MIESFDFIVGRMVDELYFEPGRCTKPVKISCSHTLKHGRTKLFFPLKSLSLKGQSEIKCYFREAAGHREVVALTF